MGAETHTPPATELIYLPEPSWAPIIFAAGLTGALLGIFIWWVYSAVALIFMLPALRYVSTRGIEQIEYLPRKQKLTTGVLPAVPPRKPTVAERT